RLPQDIAGSHLRTENPMRKLITSLFASTVLALPIFALPAGASMQAAHHPGQPATSALYLCDGNGAGYCKSLVPGTTPLAGEQIFPIPSSSAWTWNRVVYGTVSSNTFTYQPIDNQLIGQPIILLKLHANTTFCNGNSGGADILKDCGPDFGNNASERWVLDPANGYLVNVGRSN